MKIGQLINGYLVIGVDGRNFSTKGSGLSMWTFVRKDGVDYFMKEFLSPTYPTASSPGSEKLKEKKRLECEEFENHHRKLIGKVMKSVSLGSNLVFTRDFFRFNSKYYKITEKVNVSSLASHNIFKLHFPQRITILRSVTHSLNILHKLGIVHGDLKPNNILIKQKVDATYTTKLIDFDNSYFEKNPPVLRDEVVGDPVYYSPELERYVLNTKDSSAEELTCKSDIFALGILFCQYLTGALPDGVSTDKYSSNAVNNGAVIVMKNGARIPKSLVELVNSMLLANPENRPSAEGIFQFLKKISTGLQSIRTDKKNIIDAEESSDDSSPTIKEKKIPERNIIRNGKLTISIGFKK